MSRNEPLGPHSKAVEHLLIARGKYQLASRRGFAVWRVALHRLQVRQMILGLDPLPAQEECIAILHSSDPAIRTASDNQHVVELCSQSRKLLRLSSEETHLHRENFMALLRTITSQLISMEEWRKTTPEAWQPEFVEPGTKIHREWPRDTRLPSFATSNMRLFYDPWIAYKTGFHHIGCLILRTHLYDLTKKVGIVASDAYEPISAAELNAQREAIDRETSALCEIAAPLVHLQESGDEKGYPWRYNAYSKKTSQFFALAACWTLRRCDYASVEQKEFAEAALSIIHNSNSLETSKLQR